ncbi:biotin transporter BioY [Lacrimispora sp. 210928-DFI.3.58]|uniref:biotin transporter BioY n=1 Tax=Lacrimispora sp. 210928-DFI.3.58 TaxID=2883214 RepID=UPI001D062879|nr:biotin transporter BioY [Lacrimispora sp. 210928-DFI.3.58]MCB7320668.1 biotin transporter BioY [Lacrimispora sp. 210928-DFI.3.58]
MNTTPSSIHASAAKRRISTQSIVLVGMFAAVLAVISQISLPMPSGVPITIQVFGIALVGTVLGWKMGFFATVVYILLGAVGLPVFANFRGGIQVLVGMSGGYILAWPVMAVLSGIRPKTENKTRNLAVMIILSIIGLMIVEFAGAFQWSRLTSDMSLSAIIAYSFVAFIPKDVIITVVAVVIGNQMRKPLIRGGYLK